MKVLCTIALFFVCLTGHGQRTYIYGEVRDSASHRAMIGVHVRNINEGSVTFTNPYGKFKMTTKVGDTLIFSSVGHTTLAWVVVESWFEKEEITFLLPIHVVYLDEVVIRDFPEYEQFKHQIINTKIADTTFHVFGVTPVIVTGDKRLRKAHINNPFFVLFHPTDFLHQKLGKNPKEKRKYYEIQQRQHMTEKAHLKFTREWVAESTKLAGDKLTSFIVYCKFSIDYLAKTPLYMIHEKMMEMLPVFLEEYADHF